MFRGLKELDIFIDCLLKLASPDVCVPYVGCLALGEIIILSSIRPDSVVLVCDLSCLIASMASRVGESIGLQPGSRAIAQFLVLARGGASTKWSSFRFTWA